MIVPVLSSLNLRAPDLALLRLLKQSEVTKIRSNVIALAAYATGLNGAALTEAIRIGAALTVSADEIENTY